MENICEISKNIHQTYGLTYVVNMKIWYFI